MALRDRLRALPSIVGSAPALVTTHQDPRTLLVQFLTEAIEADVPEPHAITLITVDSSNRPDARVLIIKDINETGDIAIATSGKSAKGEQLSNNPHVALSWYCSPHARAIRIRGLASLADSKVALADFQARSNRAKAIATAGTQSSAVPSDTNRSALIDDMESKLAERGDEESPGTMDWQVWLIAPQEIEFWQGAKDRNHDRLKYNRTEGGWERTMLWP